MRIRYFDVLARSFALLLVGGAATGIASAFLFMAWGRRIHEEYERNPWPSIPKHHVKWTQDDALVGPGCADARVEGIDLEGRPTLDEGRFAWFSRMSPADNRWTLDYREPDAGVDVHSKTDGGTWRFRPNTGTWLEGPAGNVIGSIGDSGWVPGRVVTSRVSRARWWEALWNYPGATFLVEDGLYHVDPERRCQDHLVRAPVDLSRALATRYGNRNWWVAPDSILWMDCVPGGTYGSLPCPPGTDFATLRVSARGNGLMLKSEVPGSRTDTRVDYRVSVIDEQGRLLASGLHSSVAPPGLRFLSPSEEYRRDFRRAAEILPGGLERVLSSALLPPGPVLGLRHAPYEPQLGILGHERELQGLAYLVHLPVGIAMAVALASWVFLSCRRQGRGLASTSAWVALALLFGIPGALTYAIGADFLPLEVCGGCRRKFPTPRPACPFCGTAAGAPPRLGIEMLKAPGGTERAGN